jgi:mono/diheme cytochrome c family protein
MKTGTSVTSVLALLATAAMAAEPNKTSRAREVFVESCVLCHGDTGSPPPMAKNLGVADLSSAEWQASRTDDQIRKVIADGSPKPNSLMRAFKDELEAEDIDALVKYIRTLGKPAGPPKKK